MTYPTALSMLVFTGAVFSGFCQETCKFGGYTCKCESVENHTEVRCTSIRDRILKKLYSLTTNNIELVSLAHNRIEHAPDGVFDSLNSTLKNLSLSHNVLDRIPASILTLTKMRELLLDYNSIFVVSSNTFQGLPQLLRIDLDKNDIETIEDQAFEGLGCLTNLEMQGNRLRDIPTQALIVLESLEMLTLSYNYIKMIPANAFKSNTRLKTIDLSHNELANSNPVPIDAFAGLECTLEVLNLGLNYLTEIPSDALNRLANLKTLYLHHNGFRNVSAYAFSGLTSLTKLSLQGGKITNIDDNALVGLENTLNKLNVGYNKIESIDQCMIRAFTNLTGLYFSYNKIPCNCSYIWLRKWLNVSRNYDTNNCLSDKTVTGLKEWEAFLQNCPNAPMPNCSRTPAEVQQPPVPTASICKATVVTSCSAVPNESNTQINVTQITTNQPSMGLSRASVLSTSVPTQLPATPVPTQTMSTSVPTQALKTSVSSKEVATPVLRTSSSTQVEATSVSKPAPTPPLTSMLVITQEITTTSESIPALTTTSAVTTTSVPKRAQTVPTITPTPVSTVPTPSVHIPPTNASNGTGISNPSKSNDSQNTGMIAGVVVSLVVVAILIALGIYFIIFKRKAGQCMLRSRSIRSRGYRETDVLVLN
ncbi:unnamed protein product [Owenia fusiformis]|uniref:Uncharacterized protein n=1 Tax=Owenia fusiformis TaxID=6347 RepID=A0A8J1TJI2_OWEFU|nr:unnamed protein product [Owenia fusiformis]